MRMQLLLLTLIIAIAREVKPAQANVLFRFAWDFHVKSDDSTENEGVIDKTLIFENGSVKIKNNLHPDESIEEEIIGQPNELPLDITTIGPLPEAINDFWLQEQNLIGPTEKELKEIVEALTKLNEEILPVVGRSDFMSSKVKMITRYLNILDATATEALNSNSTNPSTRNKFECLRKFIKLAEKLKEPPSEMNGGERSVEYMAMKLALEKYKIAKLHSEVKDQVVAAEKVWKQYIKSKVIEVQI